MLYGTFALPGWGGLFVLLYNTHSVTAFRRASSLRREPLTLLVRHRISLPSKFL